jgi:hypothetical protein
MARTFLPNLFTALLAGSLGACQATPAGPPGSDRATVKAEYLVTLAEGAKPSLIQSGFNDLGLEVVEALELDRPTFRIRLERDPGIEALRQRADSHPGIRSLQPNYRHSTPEGPGLEGPQ